MLLPTPLSYGITPYQKGQDGQYYDVGGIYQTFETEEEAQEYADTLNSAEHIIVKLFAAEGCNEQQEQPESRITLTLSARKSRLITAAISLKVISEISGDVSMRDITLPEAVQAFPINRVEKIGYIRRLLGQQAEMELPSEEKTQATVAPTVETVAEYPAVENGLPYDITIQKIRFDEPEKKRTDEAPAVTSDRNNYRITEDTLGVGGAKEKFRA